MFLPIFIKLNSLMNLRKLKRLVTFVGEGVQYYKGVHIYMVLLVLINERFLDM